MGGKEEMMFVRKKRLEAIEASVAGLIRELEYGYVRCYLVECEICGCLLRKYSAYKGNGRITRKSFGREEYIYYPYYCNVHKPKEKEKKK
jgi:hypothetical protein